MLNRRVFLTGLAATTASLAASLSMGHRAFAAERRTVVVGGRPARVVDIHAHCVIPEVEKVIAGTPLARNLPASQLLDAQRLQAMDTRGIDVQALSINQYWWYEADRDLASAIVRTQDEGLARWCDAHPDRFVALTSVSLQYPELAAEQLEYAVTQLGMRGASIGGHVQGEVPFSSRFDPFWARAEALGVPVFMHPGGAENVVCEGALDGAGDLGNVIGNPLETTVFLSRMIFEGTLDRFPRLKIAAAHGGGYLPSYLGRSEVACEYRNNANCANSKRPSEYLKSQILVDSMVFSDEGLRHLVAECGPSQVVYGSDLPFGWPDTIDLIVDADFLTDDEKRAILGGNLATLLRIPER
jgi:aminocarboxymuconate-semialdehyde decarboxylase